VLASCCSEWILSTDSVWLTHAGKIRVVCHNPWGWSKTQAPGLEFWSLGATCESSVMGGQQAKEVKASSVKQKSDKQTRTTSRLLTTTDIFSESGGTDIMRVSSSAVMICVYFFIYFLSNGGYWYQWIPPQISRYWSGVESVPMQYTNYWAGIIWLQCIVPC